LDAINVVLEASGEFVNALGQNEPNPWLSSTTIDFTLAEGSEASLSIFDATGKVLYSQTAVYPAGKQHVVINAKDLGFGSGILYYKLESGEFTATRKMFHIE